MKRAVGLNERKLINSKDEEKVNKRRGKII
jgi:hypothetical protein